MKAIFALLFMAAMVVMSGSGYSSSGTGPPALASKTELSIFQPQQLLPASPVQCDVVFLTPGPDLVPYNAIATAAVPAYNHQQQLVFYTPCRKAMHMARKTCSLSCNHPSRSRYTSKTFG